MGLVITPQSKIDEYFESDRKSQSKLKSLLGGLESFLNDQQKPENELHYSEKGHFIIGSAVDCRLTGEPDRYEEEYYVSTLEKKPTEVEMSITQMIFDDVVNSYTPLEIEEEGFEFNTLSQYPGSIQKAVEEHNWQPRWKAETKTDKIIENCSMYFEDLKRAYGKQILSQEQVQIIDSIVMSLTTNPRTRSYFDREMQMSNPFVDFYYQLPIYFEYEGEECKALLDIVMIFKDENGIPTHAEPIDLKTFHGNTVEFITSVKSRRYDIQAAWYTLALESWLVANNMAGVRISPFKWIVESTGITGNPLVYICEEELFNIGKSGRPELDNVCIAKDDIHDVYTIKYKEIKGYEQLMADYKWFEENNWKEEKVVKKNDGVLRIDWNGIIN